MRIVAFSFVTQLSPEYPEPCAVRANGAAMKTATATLSIVRRQRAKLPHHPCRPRFDSIDTPSRARLPEALRERSTIDPQTIFCHRERCLRNSQLTMQSRFYSDAEHALI